MLCEIQPNVKIKTTHTTNGLTLYDYHFSTSTGITTNQGRGDRAFPDGQLVIPLVLQPFHYLPAQANHRTVNGYVMLMTMSNTWKQAKSCEKLRSLWAKTSSSATAKSTAHPSCLVGVLYDISREKICWWLINHFYVIGHESYRILRNNAKWWPLRRSRSFRVTDFCTNRKLICNFLLVININLLPIQ